MAGNTSITYRDAGVDIDAGETLVERIKPAVKRSMRPEVLAGLGGFGALFELPVERFRRPVLVSGTDGVGTKLRLAIETGKHDSIGIDLVAMCANDVVVQGAEPLFFLDYYATGKLSVDIAANVINGIVEGCVQAGAALIGGETAEMPSMYAAGDYDLAGFCVGIVEKDAIIDGSRTQVGDAIIGLASSGTHSNGYSLIRKLLQVAGANQTTRLNSHANSPLLYDVLLTPTRIYVKSLLALLKSIPVKGFAHITGGGLTDNIPRMVPDGMDVALKKGSWPTPEIFSWLQRAGNISDAEMHRTFNCGIGMTMCIGQEHVETALKLLRTNGEVATVIGVVRQGDPGKECRVVIEG